MGKVAKLVTVSLMTRVIVDEGATEAEIIEKASIKLAEKIQNELSEHIESVDDDNECPYDPLYDEYPFEG